MEVNIEFKEVKDDIYNLEWLKLDGSLTERGENKLIELKLLINQRLKMLEMLEKIAHGEFYIGVQEIRQLIKEVTEI